MKPKSKNNGKKEFPKEGSEYDLLNYKSWYCYINRPGVAKKIKRKMNKRLRKYYKLKLNKL